MCIIIAKPVGVELPIDKYLIDAELSNPHGMGVAYKKDNKTYIKKGFDNVNDFIKYLHNNITNENPAMIHFRYATHGLVDAGNCHPFPISKDLEVMREVDTVSDFAVVHNGVLSDYRDKEERYSDSQLFIADVLAEPVIKDNLEDDTVMQLIESYISSDKLGILTDKSDDIILIGNFILDEDDCYYSNRSYKSYDLDWELPMSMVDPSTAFEIVDEIVSKCDYCYVKDTHCYVLDTDKKTYAVCDDCYVLFNEYGFEDLFNYTECPNCYRLVAEDNLKYSDAYMGMVCHRCYDDFLDSVEFVGG